MKHVKVISLKTLIELLEVSRSTIFSWTNPKSKQFKPNFPSKIKIGERRIAFRLIDIEQWLEDEARNTKTKKKGD